MKRLRTLIADSAAGRTIGPLTRPGDRKPKPDMTRAGHIFVATVLALAGGSCGKFGLFHGPDGAPDERDAGDAASADATTDHATGGDAPGDAPPAGPPFATIVRVTNAGAADIKLVRGQVGACGLGLLIQGGEPVATPTSIEPPDYFCDCATCASRSDGSPRCTFNDPICNEPPYVLAPGAHFDYPWDGVALVWLLPLSAPPCTGRCSVSAPIPAGSYVFTLQHSTGDHTIQATLPAPGGIVELPVQ